MTPFDLQPDAPSRECRFCHHRALYANLTCDNCGARWRGPITSPTNWAKTALVASNSTFTRGARVPTAAVYNSTHNTEREFKSVLWWILAELLIMVAGTMGIAWISAPPY